jgi:hypothetical protein
VGLDARRTLLTAHFTLAEFDSRDGALVHGRHEDDVRNWCRWIGEPLRARFGAVTIHSGYRSYARNRLVGGAPNSVHLLRTPLPDRGAGSTAVAVAADVTCDHGAPSSWAHWFLEHRAAHPQLHPRHRGGLGVYDAFVHLDTGSRRRW